MKNEKYENILEDENKNFLYFRESSSSSQKNKNESILPFVFNITKTMIGASIVTFPYAVKISNPFFVICITPIIATISATCAYFLVYISKNINIFAYDEIVYCLFGKIMRNFVSFLLVLFLFTKCVVDILLFVLR